MTISTEDIIEDIQRLAGELGHPPASTDYDNLGEYALSTVYRRFDSWTEAVEAADMEPVGRGPSKKISDEEILSDIRRVAGIVGQSPTVADYGEHGEYGSGTPAERFGTHNEALREAGLTPNRTQAQVSDEEIVEEIQRVADEVGHAPTKKEFDDVAGFRAATAANRFESWTAAVREAGLEPAGRGSVNPEEVIEDIQRVADELGKPPSAEEYEELGDHAVPTAISKFGGWMDAVRAAGLDPVRTAPKEISNEEIIEDIQRVNEALTPAADPSHDPPSSQQYEEHGGFSRQTVFSRLGSWADALRAAGIDPISERDKRVSDAQLRRDVRRVARELERRPAVSEYKTRGEHDPDTVTGRFGGSWEAAMDEILREGEMTMDDARDEIEEKITPDADDLRVRLEEVMGPFASMECGELKRRALELKDIGLDFPHTGIIAMGLRESYRKKAHRLHFAAERVGCISREGKKKLDRLILDVVSQLGEREVVDALLAYERGVNKAFSGTTAGPGLG